MNRHEEICFSILVPVYNAEAFLAECIESALNQTYINFEVILVDDGSKDASGAICDRYAAQHDNIRVHHTENGGQVRARELAMQNAKGDFYIFLDADDKLRSNALETIAAAIDQYQCDCVIYGFVKMMDGQTLFAIEEESEVVLTDKREIYLKCLNDVAYNAVWRKAAKASIYKNATTDAAIYQVRLGEDLLQSLTVLKKSQSIAFIKGMLYEYRENPNSISYTFSYDTYVKSMNVDKMVLQFLRNENVFSEQDYAEYRHTCLEKHIVNLLRICQLRVTHSEKIQLMRQLCQTDYFCDFLKRGKNTLPFRRKLLFWLNRWGFNGGIILLNELYAK